MPYCGSNLDAAVASMASGVAAKVGLKRFQTITESDARLLDPGAVIELAPGGSISQRAEQLLTEKNVTVSRIAAVASPAPSVPVAAASQKSSEGLAQMMLAVPLVACLLIWFWVGSMSLLQGPASSLSLIGIATIRSILLP